MGMPMFRVNIMFSNQPSTLQAGLTVHGAIFDVRTSRRPAFGVAGHPVRLQAELCGMTLILLH